MVSILLQDAWDFAIFNCTRMTVERHVSWYICHCRHTTSTSTSCTENYCHSTDLREIYNKNDQIKECSQTLEESKRVLIFPKDYAPFLNFICLTAYMVQYTCMLHIYTQHSYWKTKYWGEGRGWGLKDYEVHIFQIRRVKHHLLKRRLGYFTGVSIWGC